MEWKNRDRIICLKICTREDKVGSVTKHKSCKSIYND